MDDNEPKNEIRELSRVQRRVIGVLMEKAFTTPDQYPLTLKAVTTGCNQKSNRDPVTSYSEDEIQTALDELREMSLVAEVFTDGGRAARYRHYMRYRYDFTETQFAIIAELLLRGGQQLGELRTRASRMSRIESQDGLKSDLASLQQKRFVRSSGPLERRGVLVDHAFYRQGESPAFLESSAGPAESSETAGVADVSQSVSPVPRVHSNELDELRQRLDSQENEIRALQQAVAELTDLVHG